jgi:hypothetical protein
VNLKKILQEAGAQINPFDHGATAATVRSGRPPVPSTPAAGQTPRFQQQQMPAPLANAAPPKPTFQVNTPHPANGDTRNGASKLWDQVNPFDAGRSFKQEDPTKQNASIIHQATHNGLTNAVGDNFVKPVVNTVTGDIIYPTVATIADIRGDTATRDEANREAEAAQAASLPQMLVKPFFELGKSVAYAPKAIAGEIASNSNDPFVRAEGEKAVQEARQSAFGTQDDGNIAKQIVGNTVAAGLTVAAPGIGKAADGFTAPIVNRVVTSPVASKLVQAGVDTAVQAPVGAAFGVSNVMANDPNATGADYKKAAESGAAMFGAMGATPKLISATRDVAPPKLVDYARNSPDVTAADVKQAGKAVVDGTKKAADQTVRAMTPKYNGLTSDEIMMNTKHLDTLHDARRDLESNHADVGLAQDVITGLHDIKKTYGHDFINGSRADRLQKINQFLEQNGEAIPAYQNHIIERQKIQHNAEANGQGGYIRIPGAGDVRTAELNELARASRNPEEFATNAKAAGHTIDDINAKEFYDNVHKEVGLEKDIAAANPNLKVKPQDSVEEKNITLLNARQQASKAVQDTGEKMFGSRKDMAKLSTIGLDNLQHIESQGERAAANLVTKERVLGENAKYQVNRSGDPAVEQLKHTLISAIPKRPGLSAEARAAYVKFMPKFAETVKNAGGKAEIVDKVMGDFRNLSYSDRQMIKQHFGAKFYNVLSGNSLAVRRAMYRPATDFTFADKKTTTARPTDPTAPKLHGADLVPYKREGSKPMTGASPTEIRDGYGFKGLELGNYVKDAEAKEHLGRFGDSMHDIGQITGVNMPDLIKKMDIGIGFGSRGKGGHAIAHYEPSNKVINITKKSGADGSIGHEFGHALDDFLGNGKPGRDNYASSGKATNPAVNAAMKDVMKAIKDGNARITVTATENGAKGFRYPAVDRYLERHNNDAQAAIDQLLKDYPGTKGTVLEKAVQYAMSKSGAKTVEIPTTRSKFMAAAEMQGDYWKRDTELFARTFADYLRHKSETAGIKNNYMAHTQGGNILFSPENMHEIAPAMDNLMGTIKKEYGIGDAPAPVKEAATPAQTVAEADRKMGAAKTVQELQQAQMEADNLQRKIARAEGRTDKNGNLIDDTPATNVDDYFKNKTSTKPEPTLDEIVRTGKTRPHAEIQSAIEDVLNKPNRTVDDTMKAVELAKTLPQEDAISMLKSLGIDSKTPKSVGDAFYKTSFDAKTGKVTTALKDPAIDPMKLSSDEIKQFIGEGKLTRTPHQEVISKIENARPDSHRAYGRTIDMTEANGYHAIDTADGGKIYQKVARNGTNAKGVNLENTWYDQRGNKLTQAQADAMVKGDLKTTPASVESATATAKKPAKATAEVQKSIVGARNQCRQPAC